MTRAGSSTPWHRAKCQEVVEIAAPVFDRRTGVVVHLHPLEVLPNLCRKGGHDDFLLLAAGEAPLPHRIRLPTYTGTRRRTLWSLTTNAKPIKSSL